MKDVVVTGGAGFIGTHLVHALQRQGCNVLLLDNLVRSTRPNHPRFLRCDIRDCAAVQSAFRGADVVFHLAAQSSVLSASQDPAECLSTNVMGTFTVLKAAASVGVRRVIFASSREVYGEALVLPVSEDAPLRPKSHYGASKAAAELYCGIDTHLEVVTLRLSNVYGPGDVGRVIPLFLSAALRGEPLTIYGRRKILDLVWIEDVVGALIAAAQLPVAGKTFNIGVGRAVSIQYLAEQVIAVTRSSSSIIFAPERSIEVDQYSANIDRARRFLGFEPNSTPLYGLDQIVKAMAASLSPLPIP